MHDSIQFQGADEANRAALANMSPRYRRLESLERWVQGRQYEGKPNWWADGVPLWDREPCIVYPIVQIAIQSNVDLVLGEGRAPVFSAKPGEAEESEDNGLGEDDSQLLDRFLVEHHRICRFRVHSRDAFSAAQGCGTAVGIHGARAGKPFADLIPAKWGTPKFDALGVVTELEIRYPYFEEFRNPISGVWAVRARLYRRVIDAQSDTTFFPADAKENGAEPDWRADPSKTFPHNLGACPVVWYPLLRGCAPINVIDGQAIHALLTHEIHGHDLSLSQRHRCALLSEPQPVEIGVDPEHNPTELGRPASVQASELGGKIVSNNPSKGNYDTGGSSGGPVRKKGPGYVWRYPNTETRVEYLTVPATALKVLDENARDLRIKLQEALGVVFLDPENIKFAATTSGKALEAIKQKQIDRCDQYRDDLTENFLLPTLDMQLRIAHKLGAGLRVPGIDKVQAMLAKFDQADAFAEAAQ